MNRKRIEWIDMAKGYGIILVILAHTGVNPRLNHWIYTFHLPLFFFLSGYVFNAGNNFKDFVFKKLKTMVIPYFCFASLIIIFQIFDQNISLNNLSTYLFETLYSIIIQKRFWTLWFLTCLFFLDVIFYWAVKFCKNELAISIFAVASCCFGLLYYKYVGAVLFWNIDACFTALPFFAGGYIFKNNNKVLTDYIEKYKFNKVAIFIMLMFLNLFCGVASRRVSGDGLEMFLCSYGSPLLTYISAFSGIGCTIMISKLFTLKSITYIGKNSLSFFALHQMIVMPLTKRIFTFLKLTNIELVGIVDFVLYKTLVMLAILGILFVINEVLLKTRLRFVLGK